MSSGERERLDDAGALLKEAGFTVSEICCSRPSCFDFVARKSGTLLFVKCQSDVGSISLGDFRELRAISESVSAASLLICEKARERPLEDDTAYSRYGIVAVSPKTFENVVVRKSYPLVQAGPGGCYVEIDGEAVKQRRQALGLSVGEIAEMVGLSRRTLYGYERGMAKASVAAAYGLIWALGIPVAKPLNIFEKPKARRGCLLTRAKNALARSRFLQKAFQKLARLNATTVRKAPFDFVINVPEEKMRILGGVADQGEKELDRRAEEILSVSRVVEAYPVFVMEGEQLLNKEILCICNEELSKIRSAEDLLVGSRRV